MRKLRGMNMHWVILICIQLELVLKMFLHVCSGLLPIFIRTELPADMFKLDWWATSVWKVGSPGWRETDASLCFTCREDNETLCHFFFDCSTFKPNFDSLWCNLLSKASNLNAADGTQISQFITNLDQFHRTLLLLGCLCLPFDNTTVTSINKFMASAVAKIYEIRTEKLSELEAPWLLK